MNPIETFLLCVAVMLANWFVVSGVYDLREQKQQKRIAELERENADLHFEADRVNAVKRDFNEECG